MRIFESIAERVNCTFFAALAERPVCRSRARWPTRGAVLHLASQYGADPEGTDAERRYLRQRHVTLGGRQGSGPPG